MTTMVRRLYSQGVRIQEVDKGTKVDSRDKGNTHSSAASVAIVVWDNDTFSYIDIHTCFVQRTRRKEC